MCQKSGPESCCDLSYAGRGYLIKVEIVFFSSICSCLAAMWAQRWMPPTHSAQMPHLRNWNCLPDVAQFCVREIVHAKYPLASSRSGCLLPQPLSEFIF